LVFDKPDYFLVLKKKDYLKAKCSIYSNINRVDTMVTAFREFSKSKFSQLYNNKMHLISSSKIIEGLIRPEELLISIPIGQFSKELSSKKLYENFSQSIYNFTKKWILFTLAEDIGKHIDGQLKIKITENDYLGKVLICSMIDIKDYLEKTHKRYELYAFVWNDIENKNWEENVMSINIEYDNYKEKRKIWDDIDKIVRKYENNGVVILTQVDKYEL
jgi:hypothetical protein